MYFRKGEYFPPVEHQDRIERYKENKQLVKGNHWDIFRKFNVSKSSQMYVSVNLAGIIAKKSADFLIGDGVQISAGKEDGSPEQDAFDRIKEDNNLDILFYESALANSYRGDSFFKVRYGQEMGGIYPVEFDEPRVIVEALNAEYVFPEVAQHNRNLITAYHVAIPIRVDAAEDVKKKNNFILQVESHYAGKIIYQNYELTVINTDVTGCPIEYKIGNAIGEPQAVETGVAIPLVVHVPNFAYDDTWEGQDDLTELKPLFDELNNRLSQVASILDKHSNPALAIPPNLLVEDEHGRPMFNVTDSKVFEIDGKQDIIPQYVTWNGQLIECYSEIDRLIDLILITSEIPAVAIGRGASGTSGVSSMGIKFMLQTLISKIKRKRKYYEVGLKRVMLLAQHLETVVGVADYDITIPKFVFTDGLDRDEMELTNRLSIRTGGAVTMSQKRAIMLMDGLTEEQADAEIKRIEEEQKANAPQMASPSIFNDMELDEDEADYEPKPKEDNEEQEQV